MPRVVLATTGSLGDVYPFIAVALRLREEGIEPVLAAMESYRGLADAEGIAFHPVRPSADDMLAAGVDEAATVRALADDIGAAFDLILPHLEDGYADLNHVMKGADMVLGSTFSIAARIAAEAAGVPFASVLLQPSAFCSAEEPPVVREAPFLPALRRWLGPDAVRLAYAGGRLRYAARRRPIDALRARLGLPAVRDELIEGPLRGAKIFALYPPAFAPLAADAPAQAESAGFAFYNGPIREKNDPTEGGLDPHLARFVADGPPPLVFTLGSLAVFAPGGFYETSAAAARRLGRRAVLLVGDHAMAGLAHLGGPDIMVAGYAPHALLFPAAAAVIHHGGIGTTAQALSAGVPQLVCPVLGDQYDNAARLQALGVAEVVRLRRYTADAAVAALGRLLASAHTASRARALAPAMRDRDGPAIVARWVAGRIG